VLTENGRTKCERQACHKNRSQLKCQIWQPVCTTFNSGRRLHQESSQRWARPSTGSWIYSASQKSSALKTFCKIFTQVKNISMKFCQYVASLYLHIFTNFSRFILIFNKIALSLLGVPIVLMFSVSSFIKPDRHNFIANNEWSPVHPTSIYWIIRLEGNVGVLLFIQAATEAKTVPKFTDAL